MLIVVGIKYCIKHFNCMSIFVGKIHPTVYLNYCALFFSV